MKKLSDNGIARLWVGDDSNRPVEIVGGGSPPVWQGTGWHYTTANGTRIQHPSAYAKKGWSSMVYNPSTSRIVVGREWIKRMRESLLVVDGVRVCNVPTRVVGILVYRILQRGNARSLVVGNGWSLVSGVSEPRLAVESCLRRVRVDRQNTVAVPA